MIRLENILTPGRTQTGAPGGSRCSGSPGMRSSTITARMSFAGASIVKRSSWSSIPYSDSDHGLSPELRTRPFRVERCGLVPATHILMCGARFFERSVNSTCRSPGFGVGLASAGFLSM